MNMMAGIPKGSVVSVDYPVAPPRIRQIVREILDLHGASWTVVSGKSRRQDIVRCRMALAIALINRTDWSYGRIGRLINRDRSTVGMYVNKLMPGQTPRRNRKLTENEVRKIRQRRGESATVVARDFNVDPDHVRVIWRGKLWAWVV